MAPINPQPFAPPPARPPAHSLWGTVTKFDYNLLDAGGDATAVDSDRWIGGLAFESETCGTGGAVLVPCAEDILDEVGDCSTVSYQPYAVYMSMDRNSWGRKSIDVEGRLRRRMIAGQSRFMEAELWTGDAAIANTLPNPFLSDATNMTQLNGGAATPLVYALGEMQAAIASCSLSAPYFIHATMPTVNLWISAGVVFRDVDDAGNVFFFDAFGNHVVAGAGYDGSSPVVLDEAGAYVSGGDVDATGDTAWAYASGTVFGVVGDIALVPDVDADAFDTATNSYRWGAFRMAALTYDDCCTVGVNVDLCTTCCTPSVDDA